MIKKILNLLFVLCVGLTDNVYRGHVYVVIASCVAELGGEDRKDFDSVVVRKAVKYSRDGEDERTAAICMMLDIYRVRTKTQNHSLQQIRHGFKHWLDEIYPGEGFEP